ncbi:KilA-N domain-containing protein [Eshraghiella crossota]|uniref:KilA-N domain-containing protein n=2 Tax=Eshraghiella crossota TaxID=45851 RepID=UPI001DDDDE40|nr:KilA-N domain-containing protein [Butyrivibrio crossotus]MBS6454080.1 KilA-N domain-containing protein [Butyrivibrio sp.]
MAQISTINANGVEISVLGNIADESAFISLTDIAKYKNAEEPRLVITNWMSTYSTIDFLAVWEELHNPGFNRMEFQSVRNERGRLIITPKQWIEKTNAIGMTSKAGRYGGGTYAHSDIAFEFASWISPEFKLYIIKDYQRLKKDESERKAIGWDEKRALSKINYHIHTDAVQKYLITDELTATEKGYTFADEADMLNVALFGKKAWEWRNEHPVEVRKGENIRDYASAEELIILVNMESQNAELIKAGLTQNERFEKLREMARTQMQVLLKNRAKETLKNTNPNLLKGSTD